jgi:hypothetical protein
MRLAAPPLSTGRLEQLLKGMRPEPNVTASDAGSDQLDEKAKANAEVPLAAMEGRPQV